jgi:hypothetical protein
MLLPGYRERIVHIAMRDHEGGMNLDMPPEVIRDIALRGTLAGRLIAARFDPNATTDPQTGTAISISLVNHRWTRFRTFMAALEETGRRFLVSRAASDSAALARGEPILNHLIGMRPRATKAGSAPFEAGGNTQVGYPLANAKQRGFVRRQTDAFSALMHLWAREESVNTNQSFDPRDPRHKGRSPRPKPALRMRPIGDTDPRALHSASPVTPTVPAPAIPAKQWSS